MEINDTETNVIGPSLDLTDNFSFNPKDKKIVDSTDKISFQLSLDETPDIVAYSKPRYISLSAKITAAFRPTSL